MKLFAVGATSLTVHVAVWLVVFPNASLTYAVYVPLHGCVVLVLNDLLVVLFHVFPSKLYAELFAHAHHTCVTPVILKLHAVHSFTVLSLNVNVGPALSYVHVTSLLAVLLFPAPSVAVFAPTLAFAVPYPVVFAFTVHTYTVLLSFLKLTTLAFVNVKSHVATPFTASLYVHVIVYVVAF